MLRCPLLLLARLPRMTAMVLVLGSACSLSADDWPQWRGPRRDGVWRETGLVDRFESREAEPKWTAEIAAGYSAPTVADGRVFITDRVTKPRQRERVHCFDAELGRRLWTFEYDCTYTGVSYTAGPRAAVTVDDDRAYALGTMGHLHCLDVGGGTVLWKRDLRKDFNIALPIWGIAAAPLIVGDVVIVQIGGRPDACIVALDKKSGEEVWRALRDRAGYSAPILIRQAGHDVVVCWTGDSVAGLDPQTGRVYWRHPFPPRRMPIGVATPIVHDNRLFVTSFYDGSLMLKLHEDRLAVTRLWHRVGPNEKETDALQSIISTPIWLGDHIYGVDSYGQFRCLRAEDGERVWEDQTAVPRARWSTIHFVRQGDRVWMFTERGELIIAKLDPEGFHEISRTKIIEPTRQQLNRRGGVCWAHPAFAERCVFARSDEKLVCVSLEAP